MSNPTIKDIQSAANKAIASPEYAEHAPKNGTYHTLRACLRSVGVRSSFLHGKTAEVVGLSVRSEGVSSALVVTIAGPGVVVTQATIAPAGAY